MNTVCDGARVRCVFSRNRRELASAIKRNFSRLSLCWNCRNRKRLRVSYGIPQKFPFATCSEECASCSLGEHQCSDPASCECTHPQFGDLDAYPGTHESSAPELTLSTATAHAEGKRRHRQIPAVAERPTAQMALKFDSVPKVENRRKNQARPHLRVEVSVTISFGQALRKERL